MRKGEPEARINPRVPPVKMNQNTTLTELQAVKNNLLSLDQIDMINADLMRHINEMIDQQYLDRHNHPITYLENAKAYKTYVDLPEGSAGRYKQIKLKSLDAVKKKLIEYYKSVEKKMTFRKLFDNWLAERMRHHEIEPSTRDRFITDFTRFFVATGFSTRCVDEITERDLSVWIKDTIADNSLSKKAWSNLRCLISVLYKYAKELGYTTISISYFLDDLVLPDRMFRKTFRNPEKEVFSDEELQKIMNWIYDSEHPERLESLSNLGILLCIFTGLRAGELSSLKYSDFSDDQLMVARTQTRHRDEKDAEYCYQVRDETKGRDGRRYIAIPSVVHSLVERIRKINPDTEYLFISHTTGKLMTTDTFSDKLERICKYVKIPVKRLHKIRKAYASMLLDAGVPESIVTNQMGHTEISTTLSYYYKDRHSKEEKVEAVTKALAFPANLVS